MFARTYIHSFHHSIKVWSWLNLCICLLIFPNLHENPSTKMNEKEKEKEKNHTLLGVGAVTHLEELHINWTNGWRHPHQQRDGAKTNNDH